MTKTKKTNYIIYLKSKQINYILQVNSGQFKML